MKRQRVLLTGGAGYIGSHAALQLLESGHDVVILDDLSVGAAASVPQKATFIEGNILDTDLLEQVFEKYPVDAVMHFAAFTDPAESVHQRDRYFRNNVDGTRAVLKAMEQFEVKYLVFSSTAAVYGIPAQLPVSEISTPQPINPYGESKLQAEQEIHSHSKNDPSFKFMILRYFNVAGCRSDLRAGPHGPVKQLVRVACRAALEKRCLEVFGSDYPTADGTCVRDFIHVEDLVSAHLLALKHLALGPSDTLNVGYGHGFSVLNVITALEQIMGATINTAFAPRREGDPPAVFANTQKIREVLGWKPEHDDLNYIIRTSLAWEKAH